MRGVWVAVLVAGCAGGGGTDFESIRDEILLPSCGFSTCHGSGTGGLTLTADASYANLVDVPSTGIPEMMRVVPGDPENSYLIWKLRGDPGIVDDEMPPGSLLDDDLVDRVHEWIEAGAER